MFDWGSIVNGTIGSVLGGLILLAIIAVATKFLGVPQRTLTYLCAAYGRKCLGRPFPLWECIGGRMWNLATGEMTHEDAGGIPPWLDGGILKRRNVMRANGLLPVFDIKAQDDDYIYWVVCQAPYGRPATLAFYRRPRLIRWSRSSIR